MEKATELAIDLNAKDFYDSTAWSLACSHGKAMAKLMAFLNTVKYYFSSYEIMN